MEILKEIPLISITVFMPLLGALIILFINGERKVFLKVFSLIISIFTLIFSVLIFLLFDPSNKGFQFVERKEWLGMGINWSVGLDGISLPLFVLTALIFPVCILASWSQIENKVKEFHIFLLLTETAILGVFVSLNLFLFYVFWEGMLIPMYFIIGVWGSSKRVYATIKFVLFTMVGSLMMLLSFFVLYSYYFKISGVYSFEYSDLLTIILSPKIQFWLFLGFALSFAIKVPMFPFHTWLPDAHTEAPTAGSVILAGVLLKMGAYGFIRFAFPFFPSAFEKFRVPMIYLSIVAIIYGGLMALAQKDLKRLVAYSSISHMGFITLGLLTLNDIGVQGALIQMVNHGLSTGGLFLIVGAIYERTHTRIMDDMGGLSKKLPILSAFFVLIMLSSIGLPGLNGFVGEFIILAGTFKINITYTAISAFGIVLSAGYLLWAFQRVMQGRAKENHDYKDFRLREIIYFLPIILFIFWIGLYPKTFTSVSEKSVKVAIERVVGFKKFLDLKERLR
ncbi:MAG: complex I subunit 4 family protein [Candidatus Aminicenantia bacterium]